jgi:hypothetical protein
MIDVLDESEKKEFDSILKTVNETKKMDVDYIFNKDWDFHKKRRAFLYVYGFGWEFVSMMMKARIEKNEVV